MNRAEEKRMFQEAKDGEEGAKELKKDEGMRHGGEERRRDKFN